MRDPRDGERYMTAWVGVEMIPLEKRQEVAEVVLPEMHRMCGMDGWHAKTAHMSDDWWHFHLMVDFPLKPETIEQKAGLAVVALTTLLTAFTAHPNVMVRSWPTYEDHIVWLREGSQKNLPKLVWRPDVS